MTNTSSPRGSTRRARRLWAVAWLALVALSVPACRSGNDSPEARVRATIGRAETLAQDKNLGGLKELVSDAYHDGAGQDKRAIMGLLFVQLRRHESVHLLTRIDRIDIHPPARATATVFAAMAGRPIPSLSDLPALRADLYRFDLTFTDEQGTWRVTQATWRPAALNDFSPSSGATD